jgi:hypothetical protein
MNEVSKVKASIQVIPDYGGKSNTCMIEVRKALTGIGALMTVVSGPSDLLLAEVYFTNIPGSFSAASDRVRTFIRNRNIEVVEAPSVFQDLL